LRLCDITVSFPDLRISSAKKILSYVRAVEEHQFSIKATDEHVEEMLRQALDLPNDQKNVLGLIRNLGIGAYRARQLVTILRTFQGGGFETPAVSVRSIVSDSYGRYSPSDDRALRHAREAHEVPQERERRHEARQEHYEERPPEPRRERAARETHRYAREEEEPGESPRERQARERQSRETAKTAKDVPSDLIGRRCLFHGGIAVARCGKCKAVLCKECIRGSERCPRCNTPLEGQEPEKLRERPVKQESEQRDEEPEERPQRRQKQSQKKHEPDDGQNRL